MAKFPNPKSYEQILGDMLATYISKIGVNDLNVGSAVTSFFESMAQAVYRSSGDTFSILRDYSVDRAESEALKRIAEEERVFPIPARVATGRITITDTSFEKVVTKVYQGSPPPNIGSNTINVSDAAEFTATGSIIIGRGTPNVEGPIFYSSITNVGSFDVINLSTPTTKYHNNTESVILAQGGVRIIPIGTVVQTIGGGSSPETNFSTTQVATILNGETQVVNVPVAAQEPGLDGNVPRNAIREFTSSPFTGATVTNPNPFTTGRSEESDEEIRIRIKKQRISKGLGTATAVKSAVLGAQANDENAIVTSNEILSTGNKTTLFIDNGQGYEEATAGVGLEFIVDSALGGEQFFQLATGGSQTSIAKAFLLSSNISPYDISGTDRLAITVGGILSEHVFASTDFRSEGTADAYEVVASINANSNISFSARTVNNGTQVTLSAKEETDEFIQKTTPTTGNDAGIALGIAINEVETVKLFKNKTALSRNGRSAVVESENQNDWSNTITDGETLIIAVDNTQPITYTINNSDFASEGTHTTVSKNNTLQSWINVLNTKITGATATINGNRIVLSSNLDTDARAAINIDSASTLVSKGVFSLAKGLTAEGKEADFTLSRNTAQIKLTAPLEAGDSLTAGSDATEGTIQSGQILGGNVVLATDAELWFLVDNQSASIIESGVTSDSFLTVLKQPSNILRFRSNQTNAFGNIQSGDYMVIWSDEISAVNRVEGRVYAVGTSLVANDYVDIKLTSAEYALAVAEGPVIFLEGLAFLRSEVPPQKVDIAANAYLISEIANEIENQLIGVNTATENDEFIILSTNNKQITGSLLLLTLNESAKNLNFETGDLGVSNDSLIGFVTADLSGSEMPLFIHSSFTSDQFADPPNTSIANLDSTLDLDVAGVDPNAFIAMQHPYLNGGSYILDAQGADEKVLIDNIAGTAIDIDESKTIRRVRSGDRYYLLNTLDIGHNDNLTIVLDSDAANKTFPIKLYRRAITNATMPVNSDEFRAYDTDAGATTEFTQFFGIDFDFKNYKALMQAKNAIDPNSGANEDAVLFRSTVWGSSGEEYRVGYFYPSAANQSITSTVIIGETINTRIILESGAAVTNNIDGTTEWDVTITPNTPVAGVEEVTYSWNSVGADPTMTTLAPGHYVTINNSGEFNPANTGTYRISFANSTSFTIRRPNGEGVAEINRANLTTTTVSLYQNSDTTAQEVADYIASDLSDFFTATVLDDNGTSGAGVIGLSTYEDNNFASGTDFVQLVDGLNWVNTSDLPAVAPNGQFELKRTLVLPNFNTNTLDAYAFNDGEEIRLVPTTTAQVRDFISVLAVTGITTLGDVTTSARDRQLQIATDVLGSGGAVLVSGGTGNNAQTQVVGVTQVIAGTNFSKTTISKSGLNGFSGGSIVKLEASNKQRKSTGISFTTNATATPNTPLPTSSIVELGNRDLADRYFGQPRNAPRTRGRAFHVEQQGILVCISWDGVTGANPLFTKSVDINDVAVGDISVFYNNDFLATEYTITSGSRNFNETQIGDSMTITGFATAANNGTFIVRGVSDDGLTVSVTNTNGVDEASTTIGIGNVSFNTEVSEGDTVEIGSPFANLNQGIYRVIRRYEDSIYIENNSSVEERVVIADNLRSLGFDATTQFDVTVPGNMRIEWNTTGTAPTLENARMGDVVRVGTAFAAANQGDYMVADSGSNYIELQNAAATPEAAVTVSGVGGDVLEAQIPSMKFSEYDATIPGDNFIISGNVLGSNNQGIYPVVETLSKTRVVVDGILDVVAVPIQLNDLFTQVYSEEGTAYTGYKKIRTLASNPANALQTCLVFEGTSQSNKINAPASVLITAQSKLEFPEQTTTGFDSYKYHTGLLAESNKIVYGDPRDTTTYPGVGAAGAEIFIEPPLIKRIEISINVRVNTGTPFARVTEEVRNAIAALINSSPIGTSIAISDIISQVNSVPGIKAVSISSPAYDPNNDVIAVNPSEKPFILDIVNDIDVSKVE